MANAFNGALGKIIQGGKAVGFTTKWKVIPEPFRENIWIDRDNPPPFKDGTIIEAEIEWSLGKYVEPGEKFQAAMRLHNTSLYWFFPEIQCTSVLGCLATFGVTTPYFYPGQSGAPVEWQN